MDETAVLAALLDSREAYNALKGRLASQDFTDFGRLVLQYTLDYYRRDAAAPSVDRSLASSALAGHFANPKQSATLVDYFNAIPAADSSANVVATYLELRRRGLGLRIADALLKAESAESVARLMDRYRDLGQEAPAGDREFRPRLTVEDIYTADRKGKIRVYPARLNEALRGGIRPGHNALIFGRPGAGKTLVTVNLCAGMAHAGKKVLYLANEEPAEEIQRRFISRLGGVSLWDLNHENLDIERANYARGEQAALRRGYQHVAIVGDVATLAQAEKLVQQVKPDVLVIDQIRHIETRLDMVQRQELVTRTLRDWAHKYELVTIGTAQAGMSAQNRAILGLTDLDYSNTGVQGACDLMIGVAVTDDMERQKKRMLCICRNKISGTKINMPVWIDEQHTRVSSRFQK